MTRGQLVTRARRRGWRPTWETLSHLNVPDVEVFGFGLTIDGCGVPLLARMRRVRGVVKNLRAPARDERQLTLF